MLPKANTTRGLAAALLTSAVLAGAANAAVLLDSTGTAAAGFLTGNYSRGNEFTLSSALEIFGLAYIDFNGDGLGESHTVTLWNTADQSLVASATVSNSNSFSASANGVSRWYEAPVTPLVLPAGTYRVVGLYGATDAGLNAAVTATIGGVTAPGGYARNNFPDGGTTYPDQYFSTQQLTANVVISPITVPEPSLSLLFGLGVLGLAARRRKSC